MRFFRPAVIVSLALIAASSAQAQAFGTNCTAPTNIYTGDGIPTANSKCGGVDGVNMYLGVSQRYDSPAPTTDGNGNWWAQTGNSQGTHNNVGFAKWNYNVATSSATGSQFKLTVTGLSTSPVSLFFSGNYGDSKNLGWPDFGSGLFDNTAITTYTVRLDQMNDGGQSLNYIEEVINTNLTGAPSTTVPEPSTYALLGAGLMAIGFARRRRQRVA